jgi:hypothetical protein
MLQHLVAEQKNLRACLSAETRRAQPKARTSSCHGTLLMLSSLREPPQKVTPLISMKSGLPRLTSVTYLRQ